MNASFPIPDFETPDFAAIFADGDVFDGKLIQVMLRQDRDALLRDLDRILDFYHGLLGPSPESELPISERINVAGWAEDTSWFHAIMIRRALGAAGLLDYVLGWMSLPHEVVEVWQKSHWFSHLWTCFFDVSRLPDGLGALSEACQHTDYPVKMRGEMVRAMSLYAFHYPADRSKVYAVWLELIHRYIGLGAEASAATMLNALWESAWDHRLVAAVPIFQAIQGQQTYQKCHFAGRDIEAYFRVPKTDWVADEVPNVEEVYALNARLLRSKQRLAASTLRLDEPKAAKLPPTQGRRKPAKAAKTPGRNDLCHCGSGRKFKKCHGK
jgi:hypothetical protein